MASVIMGRPNIPNVTLRYSDRTVQRPRSSDALVFCILLAMVALCRLQLTIPWLTQMPIREALYAYLYARLILRNQLKWDKRLTLIVSYLGACLVVALNTYVRYGPDMALHGFKRFVGVALLAPLASVVLENPKHIAMALYTWLGAVLIGAGSLVYEIMTGQVAALAEGLNPTRGGLTRYLTLLGEPNVGGMVSVLVFTFAILYVRTTLIQLPLMLAAAVLLFYSLSKAALAGYVCFVVVLIAVASMYPKRIFVRSSLRSLAVAAAAMAVIILFGAERGGGLQRYWNTTEEAFLGTGGTQDTQHEVLEDLRERVIDKTLSGLDTAAESSPFYALDVVIGSSYGAAGTAALTWSSEQVIEPHNGMSEIYFVGGVLLLAIYILVVKSTIRGLLREFPRDELGAALMICVLILSLYTFTYPIEYEPVNGSLFWIIVGLAARPHRTATGPATRRAAPAVRKQQVCASF